MTDFYQPIYTVAQEILGVTTIWADSNGPRPQKPYAAIKIMSRGGHEYSEYGPVTPQGTQTVFDDVEATVEIQMYGDGANSSLETFRQAVNKQTVLDALTDLAIYDRGPVQNISALLDQSQTEERASIELKVRFRMSVVDNVGLITQVTGNGTLYNEQLEFSFPFVAPATAVNVQ